MLYLYITVDSIVGVKSGQNYEHVGSEDPPETITYIPKLMRKHIHIINSVNDLRIKDATHW